MFTKKANQLSLNTIIVAIIALVVLVVMIAIFTGKVGFFSQSSNQATSCEQFCDLRGYSNGQGADESPGEDFTRLIGVTDSDGKKCYCKN